MNLKEVAKSKGTNIKQLAEKCGVPASTLYSISRGDTNLDNVGVDLFLKIAKGLDVSSEELYLSVKSNTEYAVVNIDSGDPLPAHGNPDEGESELLEIYRSLTEEGKNHLLVYARGCAASYK